MKKTKTILSVLLTAAMLLTMFTAVPFSVSAAGNRYDVSTAQDLKNAAEQIENAGSGTFDIYITDNFSVAGGVSFNNPDAVVNIFGEDHIINFSGTSQGFNVMNGTTLNLGALDYYKSLTLSGDGIAEVDGGLIYINNVAGPDSPNTYNTEKQSVCNMYDGVTVKNHKADSNYGGGVAVEGTIFNMYGGTIENCGIDRGSVCYGGGVAVINGGVFNMDGGTIKNCYAKSNHIDDIDPNRCFTAMGGGVFVTSGSTFTMNGGTISGNEATNFGGGIALDISYQEMKSNGMGNIQSKVNINGGTIKDNKAVSGAGVFVSGYFYCYAGVFKGHEYGGVGSPSDPGLSINGGTVSYNNAAKDGGGIYICEVRQSDNISLSNMTVSNNTASSGAGIMINDGLKKNVISGCTITNNASTSYGGGLCLTNNINGDTALVDTTITGNTTTNNNNKRGAGVYYDNNSKLEISGANIIQNNKYNNKLNNLNILSLKKPVYVTGDLTGSKIGVSDPKLWDDDKEDTDADAVSTYCLTSGFKSNNTLLPKKAFTSDHESWAVSYGVDSTVYSYTAKRYKATAWTPESVLTSADLFCIDAITFDKKATNQKMMYDEIIKQYNRDYEKIDDDYYDDYYYDSTTDSFIAVIKNGYNVLVYVYDTNGRLKRYLFLGASYQAYASDGQLAIVLCPNYCDIDNVTYSDSYESETVVYTEPIENDEEEVVYSNIGIISEKKVISKSSEEPTTYNYSNEVRLVRPNSVVKFHVNNEDMAEKYSAKPNDIFRTYTVSGENETYKLNSDFTISSFYDIPELKDTDEYVFKGWYYDKDNDDDDSPVIFSEDQFIVNTDVYAHWIKVGTVSKAEGDDKILPSGMNNTYSGFGLFGVQIRPEAQFDQNKGEYYYGGLRFISSISESLLLGIDNLSTKKVGSNNVEYGYVTAAKSTIDTVADNADMHIDKSKYKIQYKGENVNGVDTLLDNATKEERKTPNNFRYVTNVDCTSKYDSGNGKVYGNNPRVKIDHKNFSGYRLMTFVVNYTGDTAEADKDEDIVARAYIRYYDANGLLRTFYNDYGGTTVYGGCSTSYNKVNTAVSDGNIKTDVKQ